MMKGKSILAVVLALLTIGFMFNAKAQIGVSANGKEGGLWASYQGGVWSPFNFVNEYGTSVPWPRLTRFGEKLCYAPLIETDTVYRIAANGARVEGFIWHDGWGTISERGFYVSKNNVFTLDTIRFPQSFPTFYPWNVCTPPCSLNVYAATLTGLQPATTYYVRAYAKNACGTAYGDTLSFTTLVLRLSVTYVDCYTLVMGASASGFQLVSGTFQAYTNPDYSGTPIASSTVVQMNDSLLVTWSETLRPHVKYYIRADAVDNHGTHLLADIIVRTVDPNITTPTYCTTNTKNAGTSLGDGRWANREWSNESTPPFHIDSVSDHQGNVYRVVTMGSACWLKQNMRCTTSPRQGTGPGQINLTSPGLATSSNTTPYYYIGTTEYVETYGYIYNWCAANDTMGVVVVGPAGVTSDLPLRRGICPQGWHVPSLSELAAVVLSYHTRQLSGGCMWTDNLGNPYLAYLNAADYNETGFSVLPTGFYNPDSHEIFAYGWNTAFWTRSSTSGNDYGDDYGWSYNFPVSTVNHAPRRTWGFPLRCVRN